MRRASRVRKVRDAEHVADPIAQLRPLRRRRALERAVRSPERARRARRDRRFRRAPLVSIRRPPPRKLDFDPAHHRPDRTHVEAADRRPQIAHELLHEPRAVPALEGQLFVVNDDRVHEFGHLVIGHLVIDCVID